MLSLQSIEEAITQLPSSDLAELRDWFLEYDSKVWDKKIENDANSGKLQDTKAQVPPVPAASGGDKGQSDATAGNTSWIENNQDVAILVALVLISVYVSPIYIIGVSALYTEGFQEPNFLLNWFGAFMQSYDSTLNEYHKVLFPIMSALSVVAFKSKPDWRFLFLAFFVLLSFAATVGVSVAFDTKSIQDALSAQSGVIDTKLSKLFFGRIQETLLMYLMMLLGIGVSNSISK